MKHVNRETAEAAVKLTSARLKKILDSPPADWPLRDVIHVLALHVQKLGQEELADQVHDFIIGYCNPVPISGAAESNP